MDDKSKQVNESKGMLIILASEKTLDDFFKSAIEQMDINTLIDIGRCVSAIRKANNIGIAEVKICCLGDCNSKKQLDKHGITVGNLGRIYLISHGGFDTSGPEHATFLQVYGGQPIHGKPLGRQLKTLFGNFNYPPNLCTIIFTGCLTDAPVNQSVVKMVKTEIGVKEIYGSSDKTAALAVLNTNKDIVLIQEESDYRNKYYYVYEALTQIIFDDINVHSQDAKKEMLSHFKTKLPSNFTEENLLLLKSLAVSYVECNYIKAHATIAARLMCRLGMASVAYGNDGNFSPSPDLKKFKQCVDLFLALEKIKQNMTAPYSIYGNLIAKFKAEFEDKNKHPNFEEMLGNKVEELVEIFDNKNVEELKQLFDKKLPQLLAEILPPGDIKELRQLALLEKKPAKEIAEQIWQQASVNVKNISVKKNSSSQIEEFKKKINKIQRLYVNCNKQIKG